MCRRTLNRSNYSFWSVARSRFQWNWWMTPKSSIDLQNSIRIKIENQQTYRIGRLKRMFFFHHFPVASKMQHAFTPPLSLLMLWNNKFAAISESTECHFNNKRGACTIFIWKLRFRFLLSRFRMHNTGDSRTVHQTNDKHV